MSKYHVTFTPSVCDGQDAAYEGSVTLRMPSYDERLALYDAGGIASELAAESRDTKQAVALMRHIVRNAEPFIVQVAVKRKADGYAFSWEDMLHDSDMGPAVTEVANRLLGKHAVGNAPSAT